MRAAAEAPGLGFTRLQVDRHRQLDLTRLQVDRHRQLDRYSRVARQ